jgi:hypothetical protein
MADSVETYVLNLAFSIGCRFSMDSTCLGPTIELLPASGLPLVDSGKMALYLAYDPAENRLRFDAQWKFRTWYNSDAGQDFAETTLELCRRCGTLFLPHSEFAKTYEGQPFGAETLLDLLKEYLLKLALVSSCPAIWMSTRSAGLEELNASSWAELRGERIEIRAKRVYMKPLLLQHATVDLASAQRIAPINLKRYHVVLVEADWRFADGRIPDAIVTLGQALEMAAYDYARQPTIDYKEDFTPSRWFGPLAARASKIAAINKNIFGDYDLIRDLFRARNAWIHEGKTEFRGTIGTKTAQPEKLSRDHFVKFRAATRSALQWMGFDPL